jgi:hypothetical protein
MQPDRVMMLDEPWQMPIPASAVLTAGWLASVAIGRAWAQSLVTCAAARMLDACGDAPHPPCVRGAP